MNQLNNQNSDKSLSDLFKEVQDIRYGRAQAKETKVVEPAMRNVKFNRINVVDKKVNVMGVIIGTLFVTLFFTMINSNSIFATSEKEKYAIGEFEENQHSIKIMDILSENISETTKKDIVTSELQVPFETNYVENSQLPYAEEKIIQEGKVGYLDQTVIRTYENDELIDENIISEVVKTEPIVQIVEVGTSRLLADLQVHVGDTIYTTEDLIMYEEPEENEEKAVCRVYGNIDAKILADENGWTRISVDGLNGYIRNQYITSAVINPEMVDLCRVKRILINVNPLMEINKPSGLTREEFVRLLSGHDQDKDFIIEDNAEVFYEVERKYNVNGLFLASMAIHESNWGTSNIAKQKKNLFGYGAYDSSPFSSSYTFESYAYGIELVAKVLAKYYINDQGTPIYDGETAIGTYYNGSTISGVNVRYASDANWANRVYSIMESLYKNL